MVDLEGLDRNLKEEWAVVLDFLPNGKLKGDLATYQNKAIGQVVGVDKFTLLEVVPKPGVSLQIGEVVYIGNGKRDKVNHILSRIKYSDLTSLAQKNLPDVIESIVLKNEKQFIDFFNTSPPINTRVHTLMLLPGLGKKHLWEILREREIEPFKSFKDLKERVSLLPDPVKMIVKRIVEELQTDQKHYLFVNKEPVRKVIKNE
ncbi:MAG: DUF655 domain-containing protein [Candidatus Woesearchaeota archaeon]